MGHQRADLLDLRRPHSTDEAHEGHDARAAAQATEMVEVDADELT